VAAVREHGAKGSPTGVTAAEEHVPLDDVTAIAVVEVDRGRPVAHGAPDVVPVVAADPVAAARGVAPLVQCAGVIGLRTHIVDDIELEDVVIAR